MEGPHSLQGRRRLSGSHRAIALPHSVPSPSHWQTNGEATLPHAAIYQRPPDAFRPPDISHFQRQAPPTPHTPSGPIIRFSVTSDIKATADPCFRHWMSLSLTSSSVVSKQNFHVTVYLCDCSRFGSPVIYKSWENNTSLYWMRMRLRTSAQQMSTIIRSGAAPSPPLDWL